MKKILFGIVGVAGLAASATATTTWTTQMGFTVYNSDFSLQLPVVNNKVFGVVPGDYNVVVGAGIFNFSSDTPGFANHGLYDWAATVSSSGMAASDHLVVSQDFSRQGIYNFGPSTSFGGDVNGAGTAIANINCSRAIAPTENVVWPLPVGSPAPTGPTEYGGNSLTDVYFFTVHVGAAIGPDINVIFNGSAGPVVQWQAFSQTPPSDPPGPPPPVAGSINFLGLTRGTADGGPLAAFDATSLTFSRVVPAPGSMALLGLGGLFAARRRRS